MEDHHLVSGRILGGLSDWGWPEVLSWSGSIAPMLLPDQNYNTEQGKTFISGEKMLTQYLELLSPSTSVNQLDLRNSFQHWDYPLS